MALVLATTTGCGASTIFSSCSLSSLDLTLLSASIFVRERVTVTPEALRAAGATCTIEQLASVTYSSDAPEIATVSPIGEIEGISPGTATITGTLLGESASVALQVIPTVATAVLVTPPTAILITGQTRQFSAECLDSDVIATPCPAALVWGTSPSPSPTGSISSTGVLTANAPGTVTVTATAGSLVGTAIGTVNATVATSMVITPTSALLTVGQTQQFSVQCRDSNVIPTACPGIVIWGTTPSPSPVASISQSGVLTANAPGAVTVTANSVALSATATANATGPSAGSPFFRMDYSAGAAPLAGWSGTRGPGPDAAVSRQVGIGPAGEDGYLHTLSHIGPNAGDQYWGWNRTFTGAPFAYGDRVYLRWRQRWRPGANCRAYEQGGTGLLSGIWRNKILIVNDASSSATSRFIIQVECTRSPLQYYWRLQKGGGVDFTSTPNFPVNSDWMDVQVEMQYSSAAGATNGAYRIWINNNVQGAPTAQRTGILLHADATPGNVAFGYYYNNAVFSDGNVGWEHIGFEIDDDFDPAWDRP